MQKILYHSLTLFIALVWLVNGLYCKILGAVPRHEAIVADILGDAYASILIVLIGSAELVMMAWVLSRFKPKLCAGLQITVVLTMNILENTLCPELLLWGQLNFVFAVFFCGLVYYHSFILEPSITSTNH